MAEKPNSITGRVVTTDRSESLAGLVVEAVGEGAAAGEVRLGSAPVQTTGSFTIPWEVEGRVTAVRLDVRAPGQRAPLVTHVIERPSEQESVVLAIPPGRPDEDRRPRPSGRERLGGRLLERRTRRAKSKDDFRGFLTRTSQSHDTESPAQARRVARGDSPVAANAVAIRAGMEAKIDKATRVARVVMDDDVAAGLVGRENVTLAEMGVAGLADNLMLVRRDLLKRSCLEYHRLDDPCVTALQEEPPSAPDGPDQPDAPNPGEPAPAPTLPELVANLVSGVSPPEDATVFTGAGRAGIADVEAGINAFTLKSGPADAPSHHEFHRLQIAFEHVWQELFDNGVVDLGTQLFEELVECGVDPAEYASTANTVWELLEDLANGASEATTDLVDPPVQVMSEFDITAEQYTLLDEMGRAEKLDDLAKAIRDSRKERDTQLETLETLGSTAMLSQFFPPDLFGRLKTTVELKYDRKIGEYTRRGYRIIEYADRRLQAPEDFEHFHQLLADLKHAAKRPYRFSVYAANPAERSVNFGLVTTYVQQWTPVSYQAGRLVRTITLAPKETRRFSKKVSIKRSRAEKEVRNNQQSRRSETSETARSEAEIVQKALIKTNFQLSAEGGVNVGIASAKGASSLSQDEAMESAETKREFREAVFKASEEYRAEHVLEVNVSTSEEMSFEESGEITNPNDELAVTYLFYELQRRYRVAEQIRRLTPIVLVAQEFPEPHEIDDDWLVRHDWILRRVILDDSFLPALDYLATRIVGDEFSLQEQYKDLQRHRRLVDDLGTDLVALKEQTGRRYEALERSVRSRADAIDADEAEGFLEGGVEFLFGSADVSPEAMRVREDAARDAYERAAKQEREMLGRIEREVSALSDMTGSYTKNLADHLNRKAQIARLVVHVKENVMYYMQAIWAHEPPDQRFFRLHDVRVPNLQGEVTYTVEPDPDAVPLPPLWKKPHKVVTKCVLDRDFGYKTLEEVADLDNLLGFKGNYMLFPLKDSNVLTDFMMMPYIDAEAGLKDPDPVGNWTLSDLVEYVCCLRDHLSPEEFNERRAGLQEAYRRLANDPEGDGQELIVPTDSLFIEALPGAHPILEDFKLMHRVVDVKRAQADLRAVELDNVRVAARVLAGELADPSIEKTVIVQGDATVDVPVDDG